MKTTTLTTAILLSTLTALHAATPRYTVHPLPPNTLLNNNGLIPIPQQLLAPNIEVHAVNDAGEFCGRFTWLNPNGQLGVPENQTSSCFVYLPSAAHGLPSGFTATPPATQFSQYENLEYINNNGVAAGISYETPFVWTSQAQFGLPAGITILPTSVYTALVYGLNDWNQVIGVDYGHFNSLGQHPTPFVWSPLPVTINGFEPGITYLDDIPITYPITAFNKNGTIIGDGFLYQQVAITGLSAGLHSFNFIPVGINDSSSTVGTSSTNNSAILWTPTTGPIDLNTLIPPNSGWHLRSAYEINNKGDILGTGTYLGQPASFFLTLPEPSLLPTLLLPTLLSLRRPSAHP